MKNAKRRLIVASISLAASTAVGDAQQLPTLDLTPDFTKISPDVRKRLSDIVVKQSLKEKLASPFEASGGGSISDDDYSEFWVELRPADGTDKLSGALKGALKAFEKANPDAQVLTHPGDGFGEDVFTEVTPDFADMAPDVDDFKVGREANVNIQVKAAEDGKIISDPDFYKEILKSMGKR